MPDVDTPEVSTPVEAVKAVRPLGVGQARQLEKLVDNDFNQVKQEIYSQAKEMIEAKTLSLKGEYKAEKLDQYTEQARVLCEEYNAKVRALKEEARKDSFRLDAPEVSSVIKPEGRTHGPGISISDDRLQAAIKTATVEINQSEQGALLTLERQRLAAMRRVLIASITTDAEKILNDIPSARELMVQAARERSERKEIMH